MTELNNTPVSEPSLQGTCSKGVCCTIQYGEDAGVCMLDKCSCHTPTPPPTEWWKDKLGDFAIINELYLRGVNVTKLSAFIESLLAEQKARMVEVVEGMKDEQLANAEGLMDDDTQALKLAAIVKNHVCDTIIKVLSK